jgi:predicted Zn-dependent protease with MMP-like domain
VTARAARLARYRSVRERNLSRTSRRAFEALVAQAMDDLPAYVRERMDNVAVLVEDWPPPGQDLLGLYQGINHLQRGSAYHLVTPDRITLYRRPILEEVGSNDPEAIRREVRTTIIHEVAHHFGFDDAELEQLEGRA